MAEKTHVHRVKNLEELKGLEGKAVMYNGPFPIDYNYNALYQGTRESNDGLKFIFAVRAIIGPNILVDSLLEAQIRFNKETGAIMAPVKRDFKIYRKDDSQYVDLDKALREVGL